jgi:hypothetical protein
MSAMTRSVDPLNRDSGDEWFRLTSLLEEVRGVTEHDWRTYPKLVVKGQERDNGSSLLHQD